MTRSGLIPTSRTWLDLVFNSNAASEGGIIQRNKSWIDREIGRDLFEAEVRRRGFHLIETAQQMIVICHRGDVRLVI